MLYKLQLKLFFNLRICSSVLSFFVIKDFKIPSNTTLKTPLVAVFDDLDIEADEEDELRARGKLILCNASLYGTAHFLRKPYNVKVSKCGGKMGLIIKTKGL